MQMTKKYYILITFITVTVIFMLIYFNYKGIHSKLTCL